MSTMLSLWRRLPIIVRAVLTGSVVAAVGTTPWAALSWANLKYWPVVPWAVPLTALYLWPFWRYLQGAGRPRSTAEARRTNLRANRLSEEVWGAALFAGILGIATLVFFLRVLNRMVRLPQERVPDLSHVSLVTLFFILLTGSAVTGIVEEASFRGYVQGPIERRHGPVVASVAGCITCTRHCGSDCGFQERHLLGHGSGTSPYGFGLEIGRYRGLRTIGHGGGDQGYTAYVVRYPDQGLAVAVLCNLDNIGPAVVGLTQSVAEIYLSDDMAPPSASSRPATSPRVSLSAEELASKVGVYRDPSTETVGRIFVRDGKLMASADAGEDHCVELTPVSANRFVVLGTPIVVEFALAASGRAQEIRVI